MSTSIRLPPEPFEWDERKELLAQAARAGSVGFLEECVSHNAPDQYYLSQFQDTNYVGNFLHIAVMNDRTWFVRKVMESLNPQVIHQLLLQQADPFDDNPLHLAALKGNLEVVKLFLGFCSSRPSLKPWLQLSSDGSTPCHVAVEKRKEECALEILKMDIEQLSQVVDKRGIGLLYYAVDREQWEVATKILKSSTSFTCSGLESMSPLHILPRDSDRRDVFRLLLKRASHLTKYTNNYGANILHSWASYGKVWPFEYIIQNCDAIIPDIRRRVVNFMSKTTTESYGGMNPFHKLATNAPNEEDAVTIMKLLINTYTQQEATQPGQGHGLGHLQPPWLAKSGDGSTVLHRCLDRKFEKLAKHIWLVEKDALMEDRGIILVYSVKNGCSNFAKQILNSVDAKEWTELKDVEHNNALHFAPYCKEKFVELLVNGNPKLLEGITKDGCTILHRWAEIGYVWPFKKYILHRQGVQDHEWNRKLLSLICKQNLYGDSVFHYVVRNKQETANDIVQLLVNAYKELNSSWKNDILSFIPWFGTNNNRDGPLHEAIRNHRQELALTILSLLYDSDEDIDELLDYYDDQEKHRTLFLAMDNKCYQVAKNIVANLRKQDRTPYLKMSSSDGKNILHFSPTCTDEEFGKWLVAQAPEFILEPDNNGKTPLDEASSVGADWIIRAMLKTNPTSIFNNAPLAWIHACQNGRIAAVRAFIDCYPGRFKDHCAKHRDSPLHHIELPNITSYEDFLTIPYMKSLVNFQDSNERTPLHKAIQDKNIHLAEVLLNLEDASLDIKDSDKQSARSLLKKICGEDTDWKNMCRENGFDLSMELSYLQRKTNSIDTRNTLSVVAALLATITFTAGFTLPGGFDQTNGEAILAKKAAFLVFLIFDTIALCTSMLVLTCLIWSMVYETNKAMFLIDRSMKLLMLSLYSTMLAFVCGVFVVISQKSMWAAILVIVICSLLALSVKRNLLYNIVDKLIPSPNSKFKDNLCLLEMGKLCGCRGDNSCFKCN